MENPAGVISPPVEPRTSFWVYVPPPPLFVVAFLLGVRLEAVVPLALPAAAQWVGFALVALGAPLLAVAPALFLLRRTTIIPHAAARSLITGGPYRLTRNPMYVGLALVHAGLALAFHLVWPLVLLAFPLVVLHARVIPFEERRLAALFGEEFRAYAQRVRRWL